MPFNLTKKYNDLLELLGIEVTATALDQISCGTEKSRQDVVFFRQ